MGDADRCTCDLIEVTTYGSGPEYVRGFSRGCPVHPATDYERAFLAGHEQVLACVYEYRAPLRALEDRIEFDHASAREAAHRRAREA
jgi:hypothetical protein